MTVFVELFAGLAAVSLRLNEPKRRPPAPRMGNKGSYANAILEVLGLSPGAGATRYLWAEPDRLCRTVLAGLSNKELMRQTASEWREIARRCQRDREAWRAEWAARRNPDAPLDALVMLKLSVPQTAFWGADWLETAKPISGELFLDAWDVPPIPGAVVYLDPPYDQTQSYGFGSSRGSVIDLAMRWAEVAEVVAISEHVPIHALGWDHVDITGQRIGPGRNTTKSKAEWLTVYRRDRRRRAGLRQLSLAL